MTGAPAKGRSGSGPVKGRVRPLDGSDTAQDGPTAEDYAQADLARAIANDDMPGQIRALTALRDLAAGKASAAYATADPRDDIEAFGNLKSANDALKSLEDAIKANTEALEEQKRQYETLIAQDYQRKYNVSQSQYGVLAQAITDVVNGQLGSGRARHGRAPLPRRLSRGWRTRKPLRSTAWQRRHHVRRRRGEPDPPSRRGTSGRARSTPRASCSRSIRSTRTATSPSRSLSLPQSTMDLAIGEGRADPGQAEEGERDAGGISLVWTPATGTLSCTFKVFAGEVTDLPVDWEDGWLAKSRP
jgi:hypothetical protein